MEKYPHQQEFVIRETRPPIGGATAVDKLSCNYDLVEQMEYLYVRVVKAKNLEGNDVTGSCDPYVEVKLGNYRGQTKHFENKANPEWNQVFAFSKDRQQASMLEIFVKDKKVVKDNFIGRMFFDIHDVTKRIPPDSPLAPQWYRLESQRSEKEKGEIMLAVWRGTQADEAFPDAWHFDAASVGGTAVVHIVRVVQAKVKGFESHIGSLEKEWVNVIEAHDLLPSEKGKFPECFVKASYGNQICKTKTCKSRSFNASWNEDLLFVVAEPFEESLILSVEEKVGSKEENLGKCVISLLTVQRRLDNKPVHNRWYNLEKYMIVDGEQKDTKFASKIHLRISLDGGYHVMDESTNYCSDFRPTAKELWKPSVGILELGIQSAQGLMPMKSKEGAGTTDAYCVAKYGPKWYRTRTIIGSMNPRWNEKHYWEVFDPCTVITIGVFDNCNLQGGSSKDAKIGRIRIRLSTLETDRVNTHSYPLVVFQPSGVKKTGELQLAVRFTCLSFTNMMNQYTKPLLPKMHYAHPFSVVQLDMLRNQATQIVSMRLGRAEPPLRKEVVEDILNVDVHMWSMRRSKANFFRLLQALGGVISVGKWFDSVCNWKNPITTVFVHILFMVLILYPELILPTIFLYCFISSIWRFRWRPRHPPHVDIHLSHADVVSPDERDEEFDTFPTSRAPDIVRMRYDRLRCIAGRIQTVVGDLATQAERLHALTSWRDPRATAMFSVFCLCAAIVLYVTPFQVVALLCTFYILRHPSFRQKHPSVPLNFFRRLPSRADVML